jgi:hypothetical protein
MASDQEKLAAGLVIIGLLLVGSAAALGGNIAATFSSIFAGNPVLSGTNGWYSLPNGTLVQRTIIPTGISFKMSLVATYQDGSNSTIFEKGSLPQIAVINVGGKQIDHIDALAAVAVGLQEPLSSQARALFKLNFTAFIGGRNQMKYLYREVDSPLFMNGTVVMAVLPALRVLGSDVFPSGVGLPVQCTTQTVGTSYQSTCVTRENRRVDWNILALVQINDPTTANQLSFIPGQSYAFADFSYDGSLTNGCTDCGGGGGSGGGTPSSRSIMGGGVNFRSSSDTTTPDTTVIIDGPSVVTAGQLPFPTSKPVPSKVIVSSTGRIDISGGNVKDTSSKQTITDRKQTDWQPSGTRTSGQIGGKYIMCWLGADCVVPALGYTTLDFAGIGSSSIIKINTLDLVLGIIAIVGIVGFVVGKWHSY